MYVCMYVYIYIYINCVVRCYLKYEAMYRLTGQTKKIHETERTKRGLFRTVEISPDNVTVYFRKDLVKTE